MTPPRTVRDITTVREIPQHRYLKSWHRLRNQSKSVSLNKAPYSTREARRSPINCQHNLMGQSYRHFLKMKVVPKTVRQQVSQIKKIGIFE